MASKEFKLYLACKELLRSDLWKSSIRKHSKWLHIRLIYSTMWLWLSNKSPWFYKLFIKVIND